MQKKQPENLGCFVKVVRTERTYVCPISAPSPSLLNYIRLHINTVQFNIKLYHSALALFCPIIFAPKLHQDRYGNHHTAQW